MSLKVYIPDLPSNFFLFLLGPNEHTKTINPHDAAGSLPIITIRLTHVFLEHSDLLWKKQIKEENCLPENCSRDRLGFKRSLK